MTDQLCARVYQKSASGVVYDEADIQTTDLGSVSGYVRSYEVTPSGTAYNEADLAVSDLASAPASFMVRCYRKTPGGMVYDSQDIAAYTLGSGTIVNPYTPLAAAQPVIYSLDFDSDTAEAAEVNTLLNLHKRGEINILAFIVGSNNASTAAALYTVLKYAGLTSIPIGQDIGDGGISSGGMDLAGMVSGFPNDGKTTNADFPIGKTVFRAALAGWPGTNEIAIETGGSMYSLQLLLQSLSGDSSDGVLFSGVQLIQNKVKAGFVCAGYWPVDGSNGAAVSDFGQTAGNRTAADYVLQHWPRTGAGAIPLFFDDVGRGLNIAAGTDGAIFNWDQTNNPLFFADGRNPASPGAWGGFVRDNWNGSLALPIARGIAPYMYIAQQGQGTINTTTGVTNIVADRTTSMYYLRPLLSDAETIALCNQLESVDPGAWTTDPGAIDTDAAAYIARLDSSTLVSGLVTYNHFKWLLHNFFAGCKTDSNYDNIEDMWLMCNGTFADCTLGMKGSKNLVTSGTLTFRKFRGVKGDGSTGKADTGISPTTSTFFTGALNSMGVFCREPSIAENKTSMGNTQFQINQHSATATFASSNSNTAVDSSTQTVSDKPGTFDAILRDNSSTYIEVTDTTTIGTKSRATGQTILNNNLYLFCQNNGSGGAAFTTREMVFAFVGNSSVDLTKLRNRARALLRGLGSVG